MDTQPHIHAFHIGKRKLKTILSMFLGFCLWQLVRIPFPDLEVHPLFMYICCIIEIRDTSQKTIDMSKLRLLCTVVGLGMGLIVMGLESFLFYQFDLGMMKGFVELFLLLSGTLLTLLVAEKVGCQTFCGLAAVIFVVLMIYHTTGERYIYAILRSIQTVLGVVIAWYVNVKLFPYEGAQEAVQQR